MVHYPDEFMESVSFLVPLVTSGQLMAKKSEALEHAWNIQGYAMGLAFGHDHVVGVSAPDAGPDLSHDQVTMQLERTVSAKDGAGTHHVGALPIPPLTLLRWALRIIKMIAGA